MTVGHGEHGDAFEQVHSGESAASDLPMDSGARLDDNNRGIQMASAAAAAAQYELNVLGTLKSWPLFKCYRKVMQCCPAKPSHLVFAHTAFL